MIESTCCRSSVTTINIREKDAAVKNRCLLILLLLSGMFLPETVGLVFAEDSDRPWEKAYLNVGWYIANLDSTFRIGESNLGLGIDLDVEDFLGLDSTGSSFRIDGGWRFTQNKRHKLGLSWFAFHRDSIGTISSPIEIPPDLGGGTIGPGDIEAKFNFDIIRIMYDYSLILDDRVDFNLGFGLFVMPMEFGVKAIVDGVATQNLEESITAPLPVFGIGFDIALTPKWFIRQDLEFFYLEIDDFQSNILSATLALEYLPWKHVGVGLGVDGKQVHIESNGSDYPGVDFNGTVGFSYAGASLYLKLFY